MTQIVRYLVYWALGFALYLLLAANVSLAELAVGAGVGAVTAAGLLVVRRYSRHHFQLPRHSLGRLSRVPWQMLIDCGIVLLAILRRPFRRRGTGRFQERDFHPGNEHPAARARRALVIFGICCAPNSIPLGVSPNEKLLVHELVPQPPRERNRDWPL